MPSPFKSAYSMQVSARSFVTLVPIAYSFRREEVTQHPSCWLCAHTFRNVGFIPRFQVSLAQQAAGRGHGLPRAPPHHPICSVCVCVRARVSLMHVRKPGATDGCRNFVRLHGCLAPATSEDRWAQRMAARAWAILSLVVGALLIIVAMFGTKCLGAAADSAADNASKSTSKNKSKRMGA